MNKKEKIINLKFYKKLFDKYGDDVKSLEWGSKVSQEKRFKILCEIGNLDNTSILDVGCGMGDLYYFLKQKRIRFRYTGYDIFPDFIKIAKKKYPMANFKIKDILTQKENKKFDYVFSSGLFNVKVGNNEDFVKKMLKKMFEICKKGVGVNFQSIYCDKEYLNDEDTYFFSPEKVLFTAFQLNRKIILRHDYMPHDFTIYIYKEEKCKF